MRAVNVVTSEHVISDNKMLEESELNDYEI